MVLAPLIIVSGPSGSGKSTLIRRLVDEQRWPLRLSVSATTRPPRTGEKAGVDYHFLTRDEFQKELDAGGFLEWAEKFGNRYGTLEREVKPYREGGIGVVLDIDVQGWRQVKARCGDAVSIFVRTTSLSTLAERLKGRKTETEEAMARRLADAEIELSFAPQYDYQLYNDDLQSALNNLHGIIESLFERKSDAG